MTELEKIDMTSEQISFLGFLKTEVQLAGHKHQVLQEVAIKFIQVCSVELDVPKGWIFIEKLNAFVLSKEHKLTKPNGSDKIVDEK